MKPQLHSGKCMVDERGREVGVGESKLVFWEAGICYEPAVCETAVSIDLGAGLFFGLCPPWVMRDQGWPLAKGKLRPAVANTRCFSGSPWGPMAEVQEEPP